MRILLALILLSALSANAQAPLSPEEFVKRTDKIADAERDAHSRLINGTERTLASNNFTVSYDRCEWEVDPNAYYIKGKVTTYFTMTAPSSSITFDLMSSLTVDSVKQRNILLTKQHTNDLLTVNFSSSINAGVLDSITIFYKGPPANTGFGSFVQTTHSGAPIVWSLSEPYGSRDWWPCRNGLDDKIDSLDVYLTYPAAYKGASNGILQYENLVSGGTKKIAYWKHRYPIATYLVCLAVTNYSVFNNTVQLGTTTLPMQTFCYPESLAGFQAGTITTLNALQLYHNNFGPYPFINEKYGHVQFSWGGGMEHQTSTFVSSIEENLCAHELGHQWFGDHVTCGSWEDIWLNEGFATFLNDFYYENKYPANAVGLRTNLNTSITSTTGGSVWVNDTTNVNRIFDSRLSYNKGSKVLYMLRWKLGDSAFFRALRNYQSDPKLAYGFAKTIDLQHHFEATSGKDLTQFFADWFKGQGYPSYRVEWTPLGSDYVRITMRQTTSHPSIAFFALPVALKFKNTTQEKTIVVDNKINNEVFIQKIGFVPDTVLIDPEVWLITKNNLSVKVPDNAPFGARVYPNPINDQFYVSFSQLTSPNATINLYNAAGQRIYSTTVAVLNGSQFIVIPTQHLPAGVYTIRIAAGSELRFVKKLVKW